MKKIFYLFITLTLFSCGQKEDNTGTILTNTEQETEEEDPFVELNSRAILLENEEIDLYIKRHEWEMKKTGSGLRYMILHEGDGEVPTEGTIVALSYKTYLLTGEEIDNSEKSGLIQFTVNKSEAIPALHEVVQLMKLGSKARIVIPAHLAYGVSGDGNKVGIAQSLMMEFETISEK